MMPVALALALALAGQPPPDPFGGVSKPDLWEAAVRLENRAQRCEAKLATRTSTVVRVLLGPLRDGPAVESDGVSWPTVWAISAAGLLGGFILGFALAQGGGPSVVVAR